MHTLHIMLESLEQWMPAWEAILLILLAGWCLALVARLIVSRILDLLRFGRLCERAGISEVLRKGQLSHSPSQLVGVGAFWIVLFVTFIQVSELLDLQVMETFSRQITANLPNIVGAFLIIVIGLAVVSFIAKFLQTLARNAGVPYATLFARITRWLGTLLIITTAVEHLDLRNNIVVSTFLILLSALAFGAALAFGLGCKDMARSAMEKFVSNLKEKHRDVKGSDLEG